VRERENLLIFSLTLSSLLSSFKVEALHPLFCNYLNEIVIAFSLPFNAKQKPHLFKSMRCMALKISENGESNSEEFAFF
jgi:hypothetical protein